MCGRFTIRASSAAIQAAFPGLEVPADYRPRYNAAPTQQILALRRDDAAGDPAACWLRWGLVPFWAKDPSIGNRMINARAETVAEKPSFRNAFRQRRCLVLADGFYEWVKAGKAKVPMHIRFPDHRPFAIAGLWERWSPDDEDPLETCTLITTAASPFMADIHDRMPVILGADARDRWLDPSARRDDLAPLLAPWAGDDLEAVAVTTLVNSPANDRPECLVPA